MAWSVGTPTITNNPDGGFSMHLPILLDGTEVVDAQGLMAGDGALTITVVTQPGAIPLKSFQAWQQGV